MPAKRGAVKPPKDLNAPKRPLSAYFIFAGTRRSSLKQENPSWKLTEISKAIGEEWKKMTVEDRKQYVDEADKTKADYKTRVEEYRKTDMYREYQQRVQKWKQDNESTVRLPKKPKDENAPKRPPAGYFLFQNKRREEIRAEDNTMKMKDIAKKIGAEWQTLTETDKEPYEKLAKERKAKYLVELEEYKKSENFTKYQEQIKEWKEECEKAKKKKNKTKSKRKEESDSDDEDESGSESGSESDSGSGSGSDDDGESGSDESDSDE